MPGEAPRLAPDESALLTDSASMCAPARISNVESQRSLLQAIVERAPNARFLFTSSTATLGPVRRDAAAPDDTTKLLPQNT